jgi:hypothetical protein
MRRARVQLRGATRAIVARVVLRRGLVRSTMLLPFVLAAACGGNPSVDPSLCPVITSAASCTGNRVDAWVTFQGAIPTHHLECAQLDRNASATCADGCAVEATGMWTQRDGEVLDAPAILCAETPVAKAGDYCDDQAPCLPTRVRLATDGTVIGQDYLTCDDTKHQCVADIPPTIPSYLAACDASVVSTYGRPNATGFAVADSMGGVCLIAWDTTTNATVSGISRACLGDWDCPASALCDDGLTRLDSASDAVAVCKPGPRGVLTPAMLAH